MDSLWRQMSKISPSPVRVSSDLLARFVGNRGAGEDFHVPFREREPIRQFSMHAMGISRSWISSMPLRSCGGICARMRKQESGARP